MKVKCLGAHNAITKTTRSSSFLIDDLIALDAGAIATELSFKEQMKIKAILLSHAHYDHIRDIPAFAFNNFRRITKVFATKQTLEILSSHLIDGVIYPNFTQKNSFLKKPALELIPLDFFKQINIQNYQILPVPVNHPLSAVGYEITARDRKKIFYTGDTGIGLSNIWDAVTPDLIIIEVTFPNRLANIAKDSKHLCPNMLKNELIEFNRINDYLPKIILTHLSPQSSDEIEQEIGEVVDDLKLSLKIIHEGEKFVI